MEPDNSSKQSFVTVTEVPGSLASKSQMSMAMSRYRIAAGLSEGKDVLEVACGSGMGLGYLARSARRVVGLDFDPKLVEIARSHYGDRLEVQCGDAQQMPFADGSFDVVILLEAIYYLPRAEDFIAEARRVLRPAGTLFICSVNKEWPDFNVSPYSARYFTLRELSDLLTQGGFKPDLQVGFPVAAKSGKARIISAIRRLAAKLGLIPKTMAGKEKLKRLVFGKLTPMPVEITDEAAEAQPAYSASADSPISDYQVLYAIGRMDEAAKTA